MRGISSKTQLNKLSKWTEGWNKARESFALESCENPPRKVILKELLTQLKRHEMLNSVEVFNKNKTLLIFITKNLIAKNEGVSYDIGGYKFYISNKALDPSEIRFARVNRLSGHRTHPHIANREACWGEYHGNIEEDIIHGRIMSVVNGTIDFLGNSIGSERNDTYESYTNFLPAVADQQVLLRRKKAKRKKK